MFVFDRTNEKLINLKHVRRIECMRYDTQKEGYLEFEYQDGGIDEVVFESQIVAERTLEDIINELSRESLIMNLFDTLPIEDEDDVNDLPFS